MFPSQLIHTVDEDEIMKWEADVNNNNNKKKITDGSVMRQEHLSFQIQIVPFSATHSKRNADKQMWFTLEALDRERIF